MLNGITKSGFKYKIQDSAMDDWELLEAFTKVDRGDVTYFIDAAQMLLGDKQLDNLKKHVKEIHGRVAVGSMIDEISEILSSNAETKNL